MKVPSEAVPEPSHFALLTSGSGYGDLHPYHSGRGGGLYSGAARFYKPVSNAALGAALALASGQGKKGVAKVLASQAIDEAANMMTSRPRKRHARPF